MIDQLDLPNYIDEKVRDRYTSLSEWFNRENSTLKNVNIEIFTQGSFALGTTIKPINPKEEYDLDMSCNLKIENFKSQYSQKYLKEMVKHELELYRKAVQIHNEVDDKRRCLRLQYKDEVPFHLDIVPCVPLNEDKRSEYRSILLKKYQKNTDLAQDLAKFAVNIADSERSNYEEVSDDWHISNQQGYLRWFQERMNQNEVALFEARATVEPVPTYNQKNVLQRCIQLLKRHRDSMFASNSDNKPISIVITTLAARAYSGEQLLEEALLNILNKMPQFINPYTPRIPNPVKPEEDFTDRWDNSEFSHLKLEDNFKLWLNQATADFTKLINTHEVKEVSYIINEGFLLDISDEKLQNEFGYQHASIEVKTINTPKTQPWYSK